MFMDVISVDVMFSFSYVVFKLKICVEFDRLVSSSVILRSYVLRFEEISFCSVIEARFE